MFVTFCPTNTKLILLKSLQSQPVSWLLSAVLCIISCFLDLDIVMKPEYLLRTKEPFRLFFFLSAYRESYNYTIDGNDLNLYIHLYIHIYPFSICNFRSAGCKVTLSDPNVIPIRKASVNNTLCQVEKSLEEAMFIGPFKCRAGMNEEELSLWTLGQCPGACHISRTSPTLESQFPC